MLMDELRATGKFLSSKRIQKHGNVPSMNKLRRRNAHKFAYAAVRDAARSVNEYVLEGTYFDGNDTKTIEMSGESLSDIVSKIQQSDPNFGLYDMSFDGGWFVADYNVTAQVRSLI